VTKLFEEQIQKYSAGWNIRVNQRIAMKFLESLDTEETSYFDALSAIHRLQTSTETLIALEFIIRKLYNPESGSKGECGQWPRIPMAVDQFLMKQRGEVIGY